MKDKESNLEEIEVSLTLGGHKGPGGEECRKTGSFGSVIRDNRRGCFDGCTCGPKGSTDTRVDG